MPLAIDRLMPNKWLNDNEEGGKNQYEEEFLKRLMSQNGKNWKFSFDKLVRPEQGRKLVDNIQKVTTPISRSSSTTSSTSFRTHVPRPTSSANSRRTTRRSAR